MISVRWFYLLKTGARHLSRYLGVVASVAFIATGMCPGAHAQAPASEWIRPAAAGDALVWGRRDGILFGLPSQGGLGGPRGLIRVGVMAPDTGKPSLLNFIAIEPVVMGAGTRFSRMAFSELEASQLDPGQHGKRLWLAPGPDAYRGKLETLPNRDQPIERLSVTIEVERFQANHAHVYVVASIDSDRPDELKLAVYAHADSPPIDELTLTATMGNYERLRRLWLKDRVVDSRELYAGYTADAFTEKQNYTLDDMLRAGDGDAIALATANEADPSAAPNSAADHWRYRLPRLTQYWRVAARDIQPDLRVRVNGRRVYWASHNPLPGGIAFENFELRQRYVAGQQFIFGVTPKEPQQFEPKIAHLHE
jgi:hypothetical protein